MRKLLSMVGALFVMLWCLQVFAGVVETRKIESASMHTSIPVLIVKPTSYAQSEEKYPVLYLLHGKSGAYNHWAGAAPLVALADQYNLLIVCPDGNKDSWYVDSPMDSQSCYETHIAVELVQFVDQNYRTIASRTGRAITGQSMGGHGALLVALRHRDVFGAAGSMSGVLDLRPYAKNPMLGPSLTQRLGPKEEFPKRWEEYSAIGNIAGLKGGELSMIIDCGLQDGFIAVNRAFHTALMNTGVDHDYIERSGKHDWDYWKNAILYQTLFFHNYFLRANKPSERQAAMSSDSQYALK